MLATAESRCSSAKYESIRVGVAAVSRRSLLSEATCFSIPVQVEPWHVLDGKQPEEPTESGGAPAAPP
jgi:hypothetical protein